MNLEGSVQDSINKLAAFENSIDTDYEFGFIIGEHDSEKVDEIVNKHGRLFNSHKVENGLLMLSSAEGWTSARVGAELEQIMEMDFLFGEQDQELARLDVNVNSILNAIDNIIYEIENV